VTQYRWRSGGRVAIYLPAGEIGRRKTRLADATGKCLVVIPAHRAFIGRHCEAAVD
jgi:hypothetical protein